MKLKTATSASCLDWRVLDWTTCSTGDQLLEDVQIVGRW